MTEHAPIVVSSGRMEQITHGLQDRIGDLLQIDPYNDPVLLQAAHDARNGNWGVIYGVEGTFNGDTRIESERKAIDGYFSSLSRNASIQTGHAVRNTIASFTGKTVEDDAFNDPDNVMRTELIAARATFAVDTPATDAEGPQRTLWLPLEDSVGPLPLWRRITGPAEYIEANETVALAGDHVIEPNMGNWRVQTNG